MSKAGFKSSRTGQKKYSKCSYVHIGYLEGNTEMVVLVKRCVPRLSCEPLIDIILWMISSDLRIHNDDNPVGMVF